MAAPRLVRLRYDDEALREVVRDGRPIVVTRGLGSSLARAADSAADVVWALADRGPNLPTADRRIKIFPSPDIGPSLHALRLADDRVLRTRHLALRGRSGRPLTGLPLPGDGEETALGLDGRALGTDPMGADTEGLAVASDGSFYIADEYGPSILRVTADGVVAQRWVPLGDAERYRGADCDVLECLPAAAARRRLNRGIEGIALSPDGSLLHLCFQSALEGEDTAYCRLWTLDARNGRLLQEALYPFDAPATFRRDAVGGAVGPSDLKVCELVTVDARRLLVLERVSASSRLVCVTLPAAGTGGSPVLGKRSVLDTDDFPEVDADLEGVALLSPRALLLANDNDFGVEGVATRFWRAELPGPL